MPQMLVLYLISVTIRSGCLVALAGILTLRLRNVAIRHAIWAAALGSTMLLPVADALVRAVPVPHAIRQVASQPSFLVFSEGSKLPPATESALPQYPLEPRRHDWWRFSFVTYAGIAGFWLLRAMIAHYRVRRLTRSSPEVDMPAFADMLQETNIHRRAPRLVESSLIRVPVTVGFLRPVVLLPKVWRSWSAWDLRAVLA